jgi:hypothetical protein
LFEFDCLGAKSSVKGKSAGVDNTTLSPAVETMSSFSFDVFPNPSVNGDFTITLTDKNAENSKVNIFSFEGKKVYEEDDLKSGANYISSALKTGVYILNVEDSERIHRKKLL